MSKHIHDNTTDSWYVAEVYRPDTDRPNYPSWHPWSHANGGTKESAEKDLDEALKYYRKVRIRQTRTAKEVDSNGNSY